MNQHIYPTFNKKIVLNSTQVWIYALIIALFAQKRISWPKIY